MLFRKIAVLSSMVLLAACASKPPIQQSEAVDPPIVMTFVVPAPEVPGNGLLTTSMLRKNLSFNNEFHTLQSAKNFEQSWSFPGSDGVAIEMLSYYVTERGNRHTKASIKYEGQLQATQDNGRYTLAFRLNKRNYLADMADFADRPANNLTFTAAEALSSLTKTRITSRLEVNSEFNSDSVYANFTRLSRKESLGAGRGVKDAVTGMIYTDRFWIKVGQLDVPVFVDTFPYRNGSKVVVSATMYGKLSGNTLDFVENVDAFKKEIERIVKS